MPIINCVTCTNRFVQSLLWISGPSSVPVSNVIMSQIRNLNANRAVMTKIKRGTYCQKYPTMLVLPDGSTITTKYHKPREIIKVLLSYD